MKKDASAMRKQNFLDTEKYKEIQEQGEWNEYTPLWKKNPSHQTDGNDEEQGSSIQLKETDSQSQSEVEFDLKDCVIRTDNRYLTGMKELQKRQEAYFAGQRVFLNNYITYYSLQTIYIGALVALYGVRSFSDHKECIGEHNLNVTASVMMTFKICLVFHIAIFINSAFIGPYFEVLVPARA